MLFLYLIPLVLSCYYSVEYTPCNNNTRSALVKPQNCPSTSYIYLKSVACNQECPAGAYLAYSANTNSIECEFCQSGTYSIGGGDILSSWNSQNHKFLSFCWVLEKYGWELNHQCSSWHPSEEEYLVSGKSFSQKWYQTIIAFYPVIVKPGAFKMTYRKQVDFEVGQDPGEFMIFINNEIKLVDISTNALRWNTVQIDLKPGTYEIEVIFNAFITDKENEVQIREIEIRGTSFASDKCEACLKGSSLSGSDSCVLCETGSYLYTQETMSSKSCKPCPLGTSSLEGSIGPSSCTELKPCSQNDYHYTLTECSSGRHTKIYEWNFPLMCSNSGQSLPSSEEVECTSCPDGAYMHEDRCEYCPEGTYRSENSANICEVCEAGSFAQRVKKYSDWNSIPEDFKVSCKTSTNVGCEFTWENRGSFLRSSQLYGSDWTVFIEKTVSVLDDGAYLRVDLGLEGNNTRFIVEVNGEVLNENKGSGDHLSLVQLGKGKNQIVWSCVHGDEKMEECRIRTIEVYGSDEGGAATCLKCPAGYISSTSQSKCDPCPAGQTSAPSNNACVSCDSLSYSSNAGPCLRCFPPSLPNSDHTSCQLPESFSISNATFFTGKLSGNESFQSEYCQEARLELDCLHSFFGPVKSNASYFYLSVGNPSYPNLPSFPSTLELKSYAFGIVDVSSLPLLNFPKSKPQGKCQENYSKVLVSLGNEISDISLTKSGFNLTYSNGSECTDEERFSVSIEFLCKKEELEGWPVFVRQEQCRLWFVWPTIHACRACRDGEVQRRAGQCKDDKRIVHYMSGRGCVFKDYVSYTSSEEKCKSTPYYSKIMVLISAIIAGAMVLLILVMIGLTLRTGLGYDRSKLLEKSDDMSPKEDFSPITPPDVKAAGFGEIANKATDRE